MSAGVKRMRGLAVHRSIVIGNTATPLTEIERMGAPPDHTHKWTVAVRSAASFPLPTISEAEQLGLPTAVKASIPAAVPASSANASGTGPSSSSSSSAAAAAAAGGAGMNTRGRDYETDYHKMVGGKDDISHYIKRVQFKLHETYPQATRNIDKPPFQVTETGWGEFDIQIKIFFVAESGEKPVSTFHRLKLHPWHPIAVPASDAALASAPEETSFTAQGEAPTLDLPSSTTAITSASEAQNGEGEGGAEQVEGMAEEAAAKDTSGDVSMTTTIEHPAVTGVKMEEGGAPSSIVHETRSASAAAMPSGHAQLRSMPAVVHSWSYDEIVFPEPTEAFYEVLISNIPTPLPIQSAQAFSEPSTFRRYKLALSQLNESSGPQGRDPNTESGILPPHPLHDSSGAVFDALSQEAMLAEGERLDMARRNAIQELEETRMKLIEGESRLRQARPRLPAPLSTPTPTPAASSAAPAPTSASTSTLAV